ncbi:MAG: periplasmic heavy metal sensor [Acidobacteria bacterium]|nr:periplasmic heavy metal sensor [Acidobacteriota bacterium]
MVLSIGFFALAQGLSAQPPGWLGGGPPGMPGMMQPRERQAFLLDVLTSELGLDKGQRMQVRQIVDQARQAVRPLLDRLQKMRRAIREAVNARKDQGVLDGLHKQLAELHVQLAELETNAFRDLCALLSAEQQADADLAYNLLEAMILDRPGGPTPPFGGGRMPPPPQ